MNIKQNLTQEIIDNAFEHVYNLIHTRLNDLHARPDEERDEAAIEEEQLLKVALFVLGHQPEELYTLLKSNA